MKNPSYRTNSTNKRTAIVCELDLSDRIPVYSTLKKVTIAASIKIISYFLKKELKEGVLRNVNRDEGTFLFKKNRTFEVNRCSGRLRCNEIDSHVKTDNLLQKAVKCFYRI